MNYIINQINGAFHNYLSLYISDNDNNTTFIRLCCLFVARVVTFAPSLCSGANITTRVTNKQYALKSHYRVPCRHYRVPWANSLWHLDRHHSLIRWSLVLNGFSRRMIFIHRSSNNLSSTFIC